MIVVAIFILVCLSFSLVSLATLAVPSAVAPVLKRVVPKITKIKRCTLCGTGGHNRMVKHGA